MELLGGRVVGKSWIYIIPRAPFSMNCSENIMNGLGWRFWCTLTSFHSSNKSTWLGIPLLLRKVDFSPRNPDEYGILRRIIIITKRISLETPTRFLAKNVTHPNGPYRPWARLPRLHSKKQPLQHTRHHLPSGEWLMGEDSGSVVPKVRGPL